jgi:hypothetical protein
MNSHPGAIIPFAMRAFALVSSLSRRDFQQESIENKFIPTMPDKRLMGMDIWYGFSAGFRWPILQKPGTNLLRGVNDGSPSPQPLDQKLRQIAQANCCSS